MIDLDQITKQNAKALCFYFYLKFIEIDYMY